MGWCEGGTGMQRRPVPRPSSSLCAPRPSTHKAGTPHLCRRDRRAQARRPGARRRSGGRRRRRRAAGRGGAFRPPVFCASNLLGTTRGPKSTAARRQPRQISGLCCCAPLAREKKREITGIEGRDRSVSSLLLFFFLRLMMMASGPAAPARAENERAHTTRPTRPGAGSGPQTMTGILPLRLLSLSQHFSPTTTARVLFFPPSPRFQRRPAVLGRGGQAVVDAGPRAQVRLFRFGDHEDEDGRQVVEQADDDKLCF
jgi:hypothetical protein